MHDALLSREEVGELVELMVRAELADPQRRPFLLAGIPEAVANNLRTCDRAIDQIEADVIGLSRLRRVEGLDGPPLGVWMQNARRRMLCVADRERIEALLATLGRRAAGRAAPAKRQPRRASGGVVAAFVVGAVAAGAWAELAGGTASAEEPPGDGATVEGAAPEGERAAASLGDATRAGEAGAPNPERPPAAAAPARWRPRLPERLLPAPSAPTPGTAAAPAGGFEALDGRVSPGTILDAELRPLGLMHRVPKRSGREAHD